MLFLFNRIYNLSSLDFPEQAIVLAKYTNAGKEVGKFGMHENAVAFGIGLPIHTEDPNQDNTTVTQSSDKDSKLVCFANFAFSSLKILLI